MQLTYMNACCEAEINLEHEIVGSTKHQMIGFIAMLMKW